MTNPAGQDSSVVLQLPEQWEQVSDVRLRRRRPDNGRGHPMYLRITESLGEGSDGSFAAPYYIIAEQFTGPEIVDTAPSLEEARREMFEAAHDIGWGYP